MRLPAARGVRGSDHDVSVVCVLALKWEKSRSAGPNNVQNLLKHVSLLACAKWMVAKRFWPAFKFCHRPIKDARSRRALLEGSGDINLWNFAAHGLDQATTSEMTHWISHRTGVIGFIHLNTLYVQSPCLRTILIGHAITIISLRIILLKHINSDWHFLQQCSTKSFNRIQAGDVVEYLLLAKSLVREQKGLKSRRMPERRDKTPMLGVDTWCNEKAYCFTTVGRC